MQITACNADYLNNNNFRYFLIDNGNQSRSNLFKKTQSIVLKFDEKLRRNNEIKWKKMYMIN